MNINFQEWAKRPLKLQQNRVWRTYTGGKLLDQFKSNPHPNDADLPEEWIASDTHAYNTGREFLKDEGLSQIEISPGIKVTLERLIKERPVELLGEKHYQHFGPKLALLIKLLDSNVRLSIQCHPTVSFAKKYFHSTFGKTEASFVLNSRVIHGEEPYLLMGFKPGISEDKFKELFQEQNIPGMIEVMHRVPAQKDRAYFIPGGLPHAIGSGCFLLEIQEPTDYTIRVERTAQGRKIPDALCHQNIGFENALKCFSYQGYNKEELLSHFRKKPRNKKSIDENHLWTILEQGDTQKFKLEKLVLTSPFSVDSYQIYHVLIVTEGKGEIHWNHHGYISLSKGEIIFIPAGLDNYHIKPVTKLELLRCFPPSIYFK